MTDLAEKAAVQMESSETKLSRAKVKLIRVEDLLDESS